MKKAMEKAGVFAVVMLFLFMTTAATMNVPCCRALPEQGSGLDLKNKQTSEQYIIGSMPCIPGAVVSQGVAIDPNGQDEPFPPPFPRCSFIFVTGLYMLYNGAIKLYGLNFQFWGNARGEWHTVGWYNNILTITLEGDHAGTYTIPDLPLTRLFWASPGLGWQTLIPTWMVWNPAHDRITYIHITGDYKEDGTHIRYIDRTFTENWT